MRICMSKIISSFLLLCFIVNMLTVTSCAKGADKAEEAEVGGIERDYIYCDARSENANIIHADYTEIYGFEDEDYQEKMNYCIQWMMLDDVFNSYISSLMNTDCQELNELGEIRTEYTSHGIDYVGNAYLYGDILSINRHISSYYNGDIDREQGIWEHSKNINYYYDMRNINILSGKAVNLNDIFVIDDAFFKTLEEVDISLYNDVNAYEDCSYNKFMDYIESDTARETLRKEGILQTDIRWFLDDNGNWCIYDTSWYDHSRIPLTLLRDNMQPEYQKYADQTLAGYYFIPPYNKDSLLVNVFSTYSIDNPLESTDSNAYKEEEVSFIKRNYQYEDDVELEYFQVTGLDNAVWQGEVNDYIFRSVMDDVIQDLGYAYLNNGYYSENSKFSDRESLIHVKSILPDYYLNGQILSFTHTEEVTRKAYTTKDGVWKEEISKGPYFQAFNYDLAKGRELTFGEVFEADDELFDRLDEWFDENPVFHNWEHEWKWGDEYIQNYGKSIGMRFLSAMHDAEIREKFVNGENLHYHWFINQDEEEKHLCIYKYNVLDSEEKCLKIPLSLLADKLKPEYRDCYMKNNGQEE